MRKATNKNWQRLTAAAAALALCAGVLTGCGASSSTAAGSTAASSAAASGVSSEEADEMAAKNVADLIDAIYVQERNENTDAQCEAAKAAWDALTDAQKEMVEGEEASPDYFGRDTGDASKDDPATGTTSATTRSWSSASAPPSTTAAQRTSRASRMPFRPHTPTGLSAVPSPHRSSSTMFRPVTARRSTTWSRLWSALLPTA